MPSTSVPSVAQLGSALTTVGNVIAGVRDDQWSDPTPCTEWSVRDLVNHLVGMNLVFSALLTGETPPERGSDRLGDDPVGVYRTSGSALVTAFERSGVLERTFHSPLGDATGQDRLQIRLYDLLAHGWDLAKATGQPIEFPNDVVDQSLAFVRVQLATQSRAGRFEPATIVSEGAPAIDRLVAFLGRSPAAF